MRPRADRRAVPHSGGNVGAAAESSEITETSISFAEWLLRRIGPQCVARRGAERRLVRQAEPPRMAEPPSARDSSHRVVRRVGGLQVAVGPIETDPSQVLQRCGAEMASERVLHRTRRYVDGRGNILQPDIGIRVLLDERNRIPQYGRHTSHVIVTSHCLRTPLVRMVNDDGFGYPVTDGRKHAQQRLQC